MSLPLILTLFRIVLSPIFLTVYLYHEFFGVSLLMLPYVLLILLGASELSDLLDGFIARRKNEVTDLGKVLDPMADSIFRLTVFFTFTQGAVELPLLLVIVFFFRDSLISMLRTICAMNGVTLGARLTGKIKAIMQAAAGFLILALLIPYTRGTLSLAELRSISFYTTLITAIYTVASGVEYIYANRRHIQKAIRKF